MPIGEEISFENGETLRVDGSFQARTYCIPCENGTGIVFLNDGTIVSEELIAHECFHLYFFLLARIKQKAMKPDEIAGELHAYCFSCLFRNVLENIRILETSNKQKKIIELENKKKQEAKCLNI